MALLGCNQQWRCTGIEGLFFVSTNFNQMTDNIKMAFLSCNEQWRRTAIEGLIFVSTNFH